MTPTNYLCFSISQGHLKMTTQTYSNIQESTPPVWKMSPWHKCKSSLYDAHELKAIAQHLNRVLQDSQTDSSPYSCHSRSPLYPYKGCLKFPFQKNATKCKRVENSLPASKSEHLILTLYKKLRATLQTCKKTMTGSSKSL